MSQKIKTSLGIYLLFTVMFIYHIYSGNFSQYSEYFILGLLLLIIKDFLTHTYSIKSTEYNMVNYKKLFIDTSGPMSFTGVFLILNRNLFFPLLLVIYLCIFILEQTDIFTLTFPEIFTGTGLMLTTIISGICSTINEKIDSTYIIKSRSFVLSQIHIFLSIVLSLSGAYIIMIQTASLGPISYAISLLSGCIIFLVGISLLEDDDKGENVKFNTH